MAKTSIYSEIVQTDMPMAERMAFAMSRKTREEWAASPPELQQMWATIATDMLMQVACPTAAAISHAREGFKDTTLVALSDDQIAEVWEGLIRGVGGEAQNIASGYWKDGNSMPD